MKLRYIADTCNQDHIRFGLTHLSFIKPDELLRYCIIIINPQLHQKLNIPQHYIISISCKFLIFYSFKCFYSFCNLYFYRGFGYGKNYILFSFRDLHYILIFSYLYTSLKKLIRRTAIIIKLGVSIYLNKPTNS